MRMLRLVGGLIGCWAAALLLLGGAAAGDEFVGPLATWADAKRDYGAVADGKADDTDALQKALDDLRLEHTKRPVLYLPAGTYRITRTLQLLRAAHNESTGISIMGEDPATTLIRWDGPEGGVMWLFNPWYSRIGRLTMDGAGRARTALQHGEKFTTFHEIADMVFKDVGFGIEAGMKAGIAETAVLRCAFLRCSKAGISIQDWNSLDWWIWYSRFEDCRVGVTNRYGAGHFHVYESVFRRSSEADMTMGNTSYFGVRGNTSVGSKAFFLASPFTAGAQIALQQNTILDAADAAPIRIANRGAVLLLDNVIRSREGAKGPAVELADHTEAASVGNTFTVADPIRHGPRFAAMDDRVVAAGEVRPAEPAWPGPLARAERRVIEVAAGAGAEAIQKAIDEAAGLAGQRPVVHLPPGTFRIERTLVVPAGSDVQLVGDGPLNATQLQWAGQGAGPVLRLEGPCRATLREMQIAAGKQADAVVLAGGDQAGGRVFGEQLRVGGPGEVGLLVDGLARTRVVLHDFGHDSTGIGVKVVGAGPGTGQDGGRVVIFSGASSNNDLSYDVSAGGWLLVRDTWYESGQLPRFMRCTDSGTFTLHGANVAYPRAAGVAGIEIDNFRGRLAFLGCLFTDVSSKPGVLPAVVVKGDGADTRVLLLGCHGNGEYFRSESPHARAARLLGVQYTQGGGSDPISDIGAWDEAFVRDMLAQTRSERPRPLAAVAAGATDARFYRVIATGRRAVVVAAGR